MSDEATAMLFVFTMGPVIGFGYVYICVSSFTNILELRRFKKMSITANQWYLYAEKLLDEMQQEMVHIDLAIRQQPDLQTDEISNLQNDIKQTIEEIMPRKLRNFHEDSTIQLPPRIKRFRKHKRVTKEFNTMLDSLPLSTVELAKSTTKAIAQFRKLQALCGFTSRDVIERPYPELDYGFTPSRRALPQKKVIKASS